MPSLKRILSFIYNFLTAIEAIELGIIIKDEIELPLREVMDQIQEISREI